MSQTQSKPSVRGCVSLFSGTAALDLGLERSGFCPLAWVESDRAAVNTLRANRDAGRVGSPDTRLYAQDIISLDPGAVLADLGLAAGDLPLLAGGPPCQAFSAAGRGRSVQDPRGALLWDFVRFVDAMRPQVFLVENVGGLLTAALRPRPVGQRPRDGGPPLAPDEEPGSVLRAFVAGLPRVYRVDVFDVNALNYGQAQNRRRLFIIGNRFNRASCFPAPTHGPGKLPYSTLRQGLDGLIDDDPVMLDFSPRFKRYLALVRPGQDWRALPPELTAEVVVSSRGGKTGFLRRLHWDQPSPTILTHPSQRATSCCHPDQTRALTARECARLQGFPDDFEFCGSPTAIYRQIGNAVPVGGLAEVAGRVVACLLEVIRTRGPAAVEQERMHVQRIRPCIRLRSAVKRPGYRPGGSEKAALLETTR